MAVYALSDAERIPDIYLSGLREQFWFSNNELVGKTRLEFGKRCSRGRGLEMGIGAIQEGVWWTIVGPAVNVPGHSGIWESELRFRFPESQAAWWQFPSLLSLQFHMSLRERCILEQFGDFIVSYSFKNTFLVPCITLNSYQILILKTTLGGRHCCFHFTDEWTKICCCFLLILYFVPLSKSWKMHGDNGCVFFYKKHITLTQKL